MKTIEELEAKIAELEVKNHDLAVDALRWKLKSAELNKTINEQAEAHEREMEQLKNENASMKCELEDLPSADEQPEENEPEPMKVYVINREWKAYRVDKDGNLMDSFEVEEVARFYDLKMASKMLRTLCHENYYEMRVNFDLLDTIGAVQACWIGEGEFHKFYISEEYLNADGTINEWM